MVSISPEKGWSTETTKPARFKSSARSSKILISDSMFLPRFVPRLMSISRKDASPWISTTYFMLCLITNSSRLVRYSHAGSKFASSKLFFVFAIRWLFVSCWSKSAVHKLPLSWTLRLPSLTWLTPCGAESKTSPLPKTNAWSFLLFFSKKSFLAFLNSKYSIITL